MLAYCRRELFSSECFFLFFKLSEFFIFLFYFIVFLSSKSVIMSVFKDEVQAGQRFFNFVDVQLLITSEPVMLILMLLLIVDVILYMWMW